MSRVKRNRVIIIDNDGNQARVLMKILRNLNFTVDMAKTALKASGKFFLNNYDVYFINIDEKVIEGMFLIELIRDLKVKEKHFLVAMSNDYSLKVEQLIRSIGVTYLLKKPFSNEEIKMLLKNNYIIENEEAVDELRDVIITGMKK